MKAEILALSWIIVIPLALAGLAILVSRKIAKGFRVSKTASSTAGTSSTQYPVPRRYNADVEKLLTEAIELSRARKG